MMRFLITLCLTISFHLAFCQELYSKVFGNPENPAVIFLHGGPGYNSATIESTTAQNLADKGFYVLVYGRRG